MKKLALCLLTVLLAVPFFAVVTAQEPTTAIYLHYYRYAGDYTDWNVWMWQKLPTSAEGAAYDFVEDDTAAEFNYGGRVAKIDLTGTLEGATQVGLIIRKGDWAEKDIATDRLVDIEEVTSGGIQHIYLVEGDARIGSSKTDPEGPDRAAKFKKAYFTAQDSIAFTATEILVPADVKIYKNAVEMLPYQVMVDGFNGTITIYENVDFSAVYTVEATFSDDSVNTYQVTFDGIYDSPEFEEAFTYEGDDLGAVVKASSTTFRLWAPVSAAVTLNLYATGTPESLGGTDTPISTHAMVKDVQGTWFLELPQTLSGTYYTYSVTNGSTMTETIDPNAKACGINGLRGLVVDFALTNPEGFVYGDRADNMENATDAIIYELHVRDLTMSDTWNGMSTNRGKYAGLVESGTTYEGVKTGFDHLVELGITHVQLLPIFDFGVLDESRIGEDGYNSFNWGYMPLNYNCLEGAYSADPYDGLSRITEFKTVVAAFTEAGIRVNMDVVYNHTGLTEDSSFNIVVPGYYYRKTSTGAYSNGSGTGNETASERSMMRKYIVDSVVFWAEEYNVSGFRFDLMALIDTETMTEVETALHAIDPTILVYGEPWTGGTSTLPETEQSGKKTLETLGTVAAFNDDTRDAIKGSVFQSWGGGFVQGAVNVNGFTNNALPRMQYGIVGGIEFTGISTKVWHGSPLKTINYTTCHDNNTLYDKLYLSLQETGDLDLIPAMSKQAQAIVLTSQGIAFLHAGDEFLRSKPAASGSGFDSNSYQSPDSVNQIDWSDKSDATGFDVFEYYQGLIALRKAHASFRMTEAADVVANLSFLEEDTLGLVAFTITNDASADEYPTILVAHNAEGKVVRLKLPTGGGWIAVVNGEDAGTESLATYKGGETLRIPAHATLVLHQDASIPDVNYTGLIIGLVSGGVALLGVGVLLAVKFHLFKK